MNESTELILTKNNSERGILLSRILWDMIGLYDQIANLAREAACIEVVLNEEELDDKLQKIINEANTALENIFEKKQKEVMG